MGKREYRSSNKRKEALLGMSFGKACARLRKIIMFQLADELNKTICFRCGEKITEIDDFTIEHKISWQLSSVPVETFFNAKNIAFSHADCNQKAVTRNKKWVDDNERWHARKHIENAKRRGKPQPWKRKKVIDAPVAQW